MKLITSLFAVIYEPPASFTEEQYICRRDEHINCRRSTGLIYAIDKTYLSTSLKTRGRLRLSVTTVRSSVLVEFSFEFSHEKSSMFTSVGTGRNSSRAQCVRQRTMKGQFKSAVAGLF